MPKYGYEREIKDVTEEMIQNWKDLGLDKCFKIENEGEANETCKFDSKKFNKISRGLISQELKAIKNTKDEDIIFDIEENIVGKVDETLNKYNLGKAVTYFSKGYEPALKANKEHIFEDLTKSDTKKFFYRNITTKNARKYFIYNSGLSTYLNLKEVHKARSFWANPFKYIKEAWAIHKIKNEFKKVYKDNFNNKIAETKENFGQYIYNLVNHLSQYNLDAQKLAEEHSKEVTKAMGKEKSQKEANAEYENAFDELNREPAVEENPSLSDTSSELSEAYEPHKAPEIIGLDDSDIQPKK